MKHVVRLMFVLVFVGFISACGGGGDDDGDSGGADLSSGISSVKLNLDGAIGLAIIDPNSSGGSFAKSADTAASSNSNLGRVNQDNTLSNAVTYGTLMVKSFMIAPDNNIYLLLSEPIDSCILVRIKGTDSKVTNEISCVDYTLRKIWWSNGFNEPVQFDGAGNIYYMGSDEDGYTVLRRNANGVITDLINDNISLTGFLVLFDGSVLITGTTGVTGTAWTRIITPTGELKDLLPHAVTFLPIFPDNHVYYSDGSGISRYLTSTGELDSRRWIGGELDYHICPKDIFCNNITSIFMGMDDTVFGMASLAGSKAFMQFYPTVSRINTTVEKITVYKSILSYVILAGFDASNKNKMVLYNTSDDTERDLLRGADVEVYHLNYLVSNASQLIIFDGLRFSDNQYVLCRVNPYDDYQPICSKTGTSKLIDFQLFNNPEVVGGISGDEKTYLIGGNVAGLYGALALQNNDNDPFAITINGSFRFPIAVASGHGYKVTISSNPAGQLCVISNGTGTVVDEHIDSVSVECSMMSGYILTAVGGGNSLEDGILAKKAFLNDPFSIAFDSTGDLYFSTYGKIQKLDASGVVATFAGNGSIGFSGDGGEATNAKFSFRPSIAFDSSNNLYVADEGNCRIRKIGRVSGIVSTVAGNGTCAYSGDGGQAADAKLNRPEGVAFDSSGNLYIADTYNHRIRMIDKNGVITTVAGVGTGGYSGDGELATNAKLFMPNGVAIDSFGNIYIADSNNNRIRKVDKISGFITTFAGDGTWGSSGDGGQAVNAKLSIAVAGWIALDSSDNLYISSIDGRIRKVDNITGVISTVAGIGGNGYSGDGGLAIDAELDNPNGMAFDALGNLYVADTGNDRIRIIGK